MKKNMKLLATVLMMGLAIPTLATEVSDTLVVEDVNKVRIETQDTVQRIVISGAKDDPEFHYVQRISIPDSNAVRRTIRSVRDFNRISVKKNGKSTKWTSTVRLNIGLGTMLDTPDGYDFKVWPSLEVGVGMTYDWHPYGKKNEWSVGWGVNWNYYSLKNDKYWVKDANNFMRLTPYTQSSIDDVSTSLNVFSLQVPFFYTHNFDNKRDWSVGLGVIVNWNVYGTAGRRYNYNDEDYDISTNHIGQRPFTFDGILRIGTPWLPDFYVKYSPSKFFRDSRGPEMHQLSFGICL